jgi:hypothetical protein
VDLVELPLLVALLILRWVGAAAGGMDEHSNARAQLVFPVDDSLDLDSPQRMARYQVDVDTFATPSCDTFALTPPANAGWALGALGATPQSDAMRPFALDSPMERQPFGERFDDDLDDGCRASVETTLSEEARRLGVSDSQDGDLLSAHTPHGFPQ